MIKSFNTKMSMNNKIFSLIVFLTTNTLQFLYKQEPFVLQPMLFFFITSSVEGI